MNYTGSLTLVALHIQYSALVRRCNEGLDPPYLRELCSSTAQVQRRRCLRTVVQAELIVPRSRTATRQRRAFSVAGPGMGFLLLSVKYPLIALKTVNV